MKTQLIISFFTNTPESPLPGLLKLIANHRCNIEQARHASFEQEKGLMLLCTGTWDGIAKLESSLRAFGTKNSLELVLKRTKVREYSDNLMFYTVQAMAVDVPGLANDLVRFFTERRIEIHELDISKHFAGPARTPMGMLSMDILIPAETHMGDLRENFFVYCDSLNVDAVLEPERS